MGIRRSAEEKKCSTSFASASTFPRLQFRTLSDAAHPEAGRGIFLQNDKPIRGRVGALVAPYAFFVLYVLSRMTLSFAKAPLVELIAELRWIPQGSTPLAPAPQQQPNAPTIFFGGTKQEEFYMRLGGELYKFDFNRSERIMPAGLPFVLHQPVFRFRSEATNKTSVLYQVGYGLFSVHAIPPYHSWARFVPFVKTGIELLLKSRLDADAKQPFLQVTLRYIDFFGEELMMGMDIPSFLTKVFGISVGLPTAITKVVTSKEVKSLSTKFVLPISIGDLTISVGDGQFGNQLGIVLDNTASSASETPPDSDAIMKVFNSAYTVIHDIFLELTRSLYELMQPQGDNGK